jgi:hypothetical protein
VDTLLTARVEEDSLRWYVQILRLLTYYAQEDNSVASRTIDLRLATITSKATATRSRIVLRAGQFTRGSGHSGRWDCAKERSQAVASIG